MNLSINKLIFYVCIISLGMSSCADFDFTLNDDKDPYNLAVPLINSKLTMAKVGDLLDSTNASLRVDNTGKVTALYSGEVIRQNAGAIFPAYPGIIPFFMTAPTTTIKLPLSNSYLIKNAIFKDTKVRFELAHDATQEIKVNIRILEVSKDNKVFEKDFVLPYNGTSPVEFKSDEISLDGWNYKSNTNSMTFVYDAKLADGTSVTLKKAIMPFDFIKFKYIDGYLGHHVFGIDGSAIDIGLFNKWKSGSFNFEDPKIFLSVENGFGVPVRSKINQMDLTSITGNTLSLQSSYINTGINFEYPGFNQVGTTKSTSFYFDKTNSNIVDVFNEKTKTISYDIDALVNPDKDTLVKGYITDNSFFVINVVVEVPMNGSIDKFTVVDTFDFKLEAEIPSEIERIELKILTANDFPANIALDAIMLDEQGNNLGNLFSKSLNLSPALLDANGKTTGAANDINTSVYDRAMIDKLLKTKKLAFTGAINTTDSQNKKPLWIFSQYGIGLKVGAKIDYKSN
jgi:hypothetical protein